MPEGETVPVSLGVVPTDGSALPSPLPAAMVARIGEGTEIMVSDEAAGGSPTGLPQGAVLAAGAIRAL